MTRYRQSMQRHVFYKAKHGFYLCVGRTVAGVFDDIDSARRATHKNFARGINVQIKETRDAGECITGQARGISQKANYRPQLKAGDFTL